MPNSEAHGKYGDWALTITDQHAIISRFTPEPTRHLHVPLPVWEGLVRDVLSPPVSGSERAAIRYLGTFTVEDADATVNILRRVGIDPVSYAAGWSYAIESVLQVLGET